MLDRLEALERELTDVEARLGDPDLAADRAAFVEITRRHSELTEVVGIGRRLRTATEDAETARMMIAELSGDDREEMRAELRSAEAFADGARDSVAVYTAKLHDPESGAGYRADATAAALREVDHDLEMWGCVACNLCVTVCPNDAFVKLPSTEALGHRWEYLVLSELCNECGNCNTFCPERGDPAMIKPRLYTSPHRFEADDRPSFLIEMLEGTPTVTAKDACAAETDTLMSVIAGEDGLPLSTSSSISLD